MNLNSLCPGNIISLAYNPEVITMVTMVEFGGAIQVNSNNYTDDIRDIVGILLTKEILDRFQIPKQISFQDQLIEVVCNDDRVFITGSMLCRPMRIQYLHQLQNLVLQLAQKEIIDHKKLRI